MGVFALLQVLRVLQSLRALRVLQSPRAFRVLLPIALFLVAVPLFPTHNPGTNLQAQMVMSPQSMGIGGGGVSYVTGVESLFLNPANLQIRDKKYRLQVTVGQVTLSDYPFLAPAEPVTRAGDLQDLLLEAVDVRVLNHITPENRLSILDRNYGNDRPTALTYRSADLVWFGFKWFGRRNSFAIAARSRMSSKAEVGRGFFDATPVLTELEAGLPVSSSGTGSGSGTGSSTSEGSGEMALAVDRSLYHTYQVLHEVSMGYSQSLSFLNDLSPGLSEWIVGIAPKVVFGGPYSSLRFTDQIQPLDGAWLQQRSLEQRSAGEITSLLSAFGNLYDAGDAAGSNAAVGASNAVGTGNAADAGDAAGSNAAVGASNAVGTSDTNNAMASETLTLIDRFYQNRGLTEITGYGAGLDIGITYVITFQRDLSVVLRRSQSTNRSLRLSLSMTDLGAIRYHHNPQTVRYDFADADLTSLPALSEQTYTAGLQEDLLFLSEFGIHPYQAAWATVNTNNSDGAEGETDPEASPASVSTKPVWTLLPTSFQAGAMLQLNRFAVVADLQLGLQETAFTSEQPILYVGAELYVLPFLPIRAGLRAADRLRGYYSLGAGLDFRFLELNAAVQVRSNRRGPTTEPIGAALAGLRVHFGR